MDHPGDEGNTAVANVMAADAAGRLLHCVVEQSIRIQGQDYGLLSPVDTPAHLCRWPDDSSAEPELIADPHQYPQVLDQLDMILQDEGLVLVRSAGLLTVAGDLDNVALDIDPGMDWDGAEAAMDASDLLHQVGATDDDDLDTYVLIGQCLPRRDGLQPLWQPESLFPVGAPRAGRSGTVDARRVGPTSTPGGGGPGP